MNTRQRSNSLILCGILCVLWLSTGPAQAGKFKLRWNGEIGSNLFLGLQPSTDFIKQNNLGNLFNYRNTNTLSFTLKPKFGSDIAGKAFLELRNLNFSPSLATSDQTAYRTKSSSDLENYSQVLPVSVRVNELYIDFYGIIPNVDIRIGQQRIAWGTATIFNPTDNLNPYNLENPVDFQGRLGVPAIKLDISAGEHVTISMINVFMFTPPVLPISLFREATAIDTSVLVPQKFELGALESTELIEQPQFNVENMMPAAKVAVDLEGFNFSFSYLYGRMSIPVPAEIPVSKVVVVNGDNRTEIKQGANLISLAGCISNSRTAPPCRIDATATNVRLRFPRAHIIGADFSTSLGGVGFWAEAALFLPAESVNAQFKLDPFFFTAMQLLDPSLEDKIKAPLETFKADPFVKVTAGLDYTFPGGWYFNLQYIYGFFNEQSWNELHHYAILAFRKSFLREKLLIQISTGLEVDAQRTEAEKKDGNAVGLAFLVNPEIHYKPVDAAQIILGGIISRGHAGTTFSLFQSLTQVYLRARFTFGG